MYTHISTSVSSHHHSAETLFLHGGKKIISSHKLLSFICLQPTMSRNTEELEFILQNNKKFKREGAPDDDGKEDRDDDDDDRPEDSIPDLPENSAARDFLKNAPSKGLWLPMGMEVKVMQCWYVFYCISCTPFSHAVMIICYSQAM